MNLKKYLIKAGKHRSGLYFKPHCSTNNFIHNQIIFNANCLYDLNSIDQYDINKLFGLSFGFHHNNSARFGWRSTLAGKIEISAYCYVNKERVVRILGEVEPNAIYSFKLYFNQSNYIFKVYKQNTLLFNGTIDKTTTTKCGYLLFPYFGGNRTAPHDISIIFNKINCKSL